MGGFFNHTNIGVSFVFTTVIVLSLLVKGSGSGFVLRD